MHVEVPRQGVELELQPLGYTTAKAKPDPNHVCDLHHGSQQCQILNPLMKVRDRTCVLMDASQVLFCWATTGTPCLGFCHFTHGCLLCLAGSREVLPTASLPTSTYSSSPPRSSKTCRLGPQAGSLSSTFPLWLWQLSVFIWSLHSCLQVSYLPL